ncbi:MAG: L,D-transpeptidase/peptidoglycan binding protein [Roseburia sp.]|nr:L,D-transpeptidase/peptidoglycan binding protein [Roseburia sp.]
MSEMKHEVSNEMKDAKSNEENKVTKDRESHKVNNQVENTGSDAAGNEVISEKKRRLSGKKKGLWVILAVLPILILAGGYLGIAGYYQSRFFRNTYINHIACGNLKVAAVAAMLDEKAGEYCLEVYGRNPQLPEENILLGSIRAQDIAYSDLNNQATVQELLERQNAFLWIEVLANKQYTYDLDEGVSFDREMLSELLEDWEAFRKNNMKKPKDAYLSGYLEEEGGYAVLPESPGSELDGAAAKEIIENAILRKETSINLEEYNCYTAAGITEQDKKLCATVKTLNQWLDTVITYDWNGTEVVLDRERIKDWISLEQEEAVLDEEAVAEFVREYARQLDTFGRNKKFTTTSGEEITLPSAYGWQVDRQAETEELKGLIYEGVVTEREPIYSIRAYEKGSDDIGSSYVEIDLSNQHLYLYYLGELVLETDFVSGNMSNGNYTPPGVYGLTYKTKDAVLRGENYATPVKYWMPFNGNVGMHDATWRRSFGGTIFMTGGSHGCINLPLSQAEAIYGYVQQGFPVICYYNQPVEEIIAQLQGQPANIPDETPSETPEENTEEMPSETPEGDTEETPSETPEENTEETPSETPEENTEQTPSETLEGDTEQTLSNIPEEG